MTNSTTVIFILSVIHMIWGAITMDAFTSVYYNYNLLDVTDEDDKIWTSISSGILILLFITPLLVINLAAHRRKSESKQTTFRRSTKLAFGVAFALFVFCVLGCWSAWIRNIQEYKNTDLIQNTYVRPEIIQSNYNSDLVISIFGAFVFCVSFFLIARETILFSIDRSRR